MPIATTSSASAVSLNEASGQQGMGRFYHHHLMPKPLSPHHAGSSTGGLPGGAVGSGASGGVDPSSSGYAGNSSDAVFAGASANSLLSINAGNLGALNTDLP